MWVHSSVSCAELQLKENNEMSHDNTIDKKKVYTAMLEQLGEVPLAVPHQRWSTGTERIVS